MKIGLDVAQTCGPRAGCACYADSLARALVEVGPENEYFWYHQFGRWFNDDTSSGTFLEHPAVQMPFWGMSLDKARKVWSEAETTQILKGDPDIVQSNSYQAVPTGRAKLVFVVHDVSFWIYPEFTTEANRLNCQYGVLEALERADGFLFISQSGKEEFTRIFPGWLEQTGKPSVAIHHGSRFSSAFAKDRDESFWLAVGSIEPRKNYGALFTAMEAYWERSRKPLPLWITASAGWKNDEIKAFVNKLQTARKTTIFPYTTP